MRFDQSQQMKLGQQMKLSPRMIQSMEVLQMSIAELEERIEQELESNATLERIEREAPEPVATTEHEQALVVKDDNARDDFERLDDYTDANPDAAENEFSESEHAPPSEAPTSLAPQREEWEPDFRRAASGERDAKMDAMAAAPARAAPLAEQLRDQWSLAEVDDETRRLGDLLISFLDDDGYLRTPLETILDRVPADWQKPTVARLEDALKALQLYLEPAGTAARDTRECLLLQIDAMDEEAADGSEDVPPRDELRRVRNLVEHHLDDLLQNRLPKVVEKTGISMDDLKHAMGLMKRLSLAPARRLVEEASTPIIPDAIVEYDPDTDRYIAYLNDRRLPQLRVNQEYARMSKDKGMPAKDREFLKTSMGNAQWLIDAISQRQHTLLRVIKVVVEAQREYFDFGPQALKPLPMTSVAEQLGIHVATVSRAVADKHLLTPRGVVPLRKFFSGGTQTDTGEDVSWDAIKAALQEVVDAEDKSKPLSDDALADKLKERGLEIARRTVAKYRDQLGIPSARLRKAY